MAHQTLPGQNFGSQHGLVLSDLACDSGLTVDVHVIYGNAPSASADRSVFRDNAPAKNVKSL
jgi:hypothetical protein